MMASVVYYARTVAGVQFGMFDPLNEPDWDGIEGPQVGDAQFVRLMNKVAVRLGALGLSDIKFLPPNTAGGFSSAYMFSLMENSLVMAKVDHYAFHSYGGATGGADATLKGSSYPNTDFWVTETTNPEVILNLIGQGATAVMVWEGFDSVYHHAILAGRGSNAPNDTQGLPNPPVAYNAGTRTYSIRPIFYDDQQIFKYVTAGATRIAATESSSSVTLHAFYNSTSSRLTIVGQNTGSAVTFNASLQNLPSLTSLSLYRSAQQTGTTIPVSSQAFSFQAPANTFFSLTGLAITDTIAPSAPSNLTATGGIGSVSLSWTAATDNTSVAKYNVHRATVAAFSPSVFNRIVQTALTSYVDATTAGIYFYKVTAEDGSGNVGPVSNEVSAEISSDSNPPSVTMSAPGDGSSVSGSVTVSADASDDNTVAGVQFKLDGANLGAEDTVPPYAVAWDTVSSSNGSHILTAVARDPAANATPSEPVVVTVSNTFTTGILGNTNIEPTTDTGDHNTVGAVKFTMPSRNGTATSMSVYIAGAVAAAPNNLFQVAIYGGSGSSPGSLIVSSASKTIVPNTWNTVSINAQLTAGAIYWLAYNTNGTAPSHNNWRLGPGAAGQEVWKAQTFGTWPTTYGAVEGSDAKTASIYVTFTSP